jgi:predicted  nucleic acid-binding Zn-ribbon protein
MTEQLLDTILTKLLNIEEKIDDVVTKEELSIAKSEILGDVDRFVKLHETLDHELVALRHKYERLEERINKLELQFSPT